MNLTRGAGAAREEIYSWLPWLSPEGVSPDSQSARPLGLASWTCCDPVGESTCGTAVYENYPPRVGTITLEEVSARGKLLAGRVAEIEAADGHDAHKGPDDEPIHRRSYSTDPFDRWDPRWWVDYIDDLDGPCRLGGPHRYGRGDYDAAGNAMPLNVLAHERCLPGANRPVVPILCRWIQDGWRSLVSGVSGVPPDRDGGSYRRNPWPEWKPIYPFAPNATGTDWDVHRSWPSTGAWEFGQRQPPPWYTNEPDLSWSTITKRWVRIGRRVFVMLRDDPIIDIGPQGDLYGASRHSAWTLGLAWAILEASVGRMHEWAEWIRDFSDAYPTGLGWPCGDGRGQFGTEGLFNPLSQYEAFRVFPNGPDGGEMMEALADFITNPNGPPIYLVARQNLAGAGSVKRGERDLETGAITTLIMVNRTVTSMGGGGLGAGRDTTPLSAGYSQLVNQLRRHWARREYGASAPVWDLRDSAGALFDSYDWLPPGALLFYANRLASVVNTLLHECMHRVWYERFNLIRDQRVRLIDDHTSRNWGVVHQGGGQLVNLSANPGILGTHVFQPSLAFSGECNSRHWIHYLAGYFMEGLLKHDVSGPLSRLDGAANSRIWYPVPVSTNPLEKSECLAYVTPDLGGTGVLQGN